MEGGRRKSLVHTEHAHMLNLIVNLYEICGCDIARIVTGCNNVAGNT